MHSAPMYTTSSSKSSIPSARKCWIVRPAGGGVIQPAVQAPAISTAVAVQPIAEPPSPDLVTSSLAEVLSGSRQEQPTEADLALAGQKAAFVHAVETCAAEARRPLKWACVLTASKAMSEGLFPLLHTAGKHGASLLQAEAAWHNFRQWRNKLGKTYSGATDVTNTVSLVRAYRGARKFQIKGPEAFYHEILSVVLHQNRVSLRSAYNRAHDYWTMRNPAIAAELPTYHQVHWVHRMVDRKVVDFSRNPERKWVNTHRPYTDCEAQQPGRIWVGDHHHLDFWCRDAETGSVERPWLSCWTDYGAFCPVGWLIRMADPDNDAVILSLRDAVLRSDLHSATYLKIDNGKDYTCKAVENVVARLGVKVSTALPFNPKAKPVERFFGKVAADLSKWFFSYCGNNPQNRPDNAEWARRNPESLPTLDYVRQGWEAFVREHMATPSQAKGCAGLTPGQVMAGVIYGTGRLSDQDIREMFAHHAGPRSIKRGEVMIDGDKYYSQTLFDLYMNVDTVHVRIDRDDRSIAYIFDENGSKLGEARLKTAHDPMLTQNPNAAPESIEAFRQEQKQKARAIKGIKEAVKTLTGQTARRGIHIALPQHMVNDIEAAAATAVHNVTTRALPAASAEPVLAELTDQDVTDFDALLRADTEERLAAERAIDI